DLMHCDTVAHRGIADGGSERYETAQDKRMTARKSTGTVSHRMTVPVLFSYTLFFSFLLLCLSDMDFTDHPIFHFDHFEYKALFCQDIPCFREIIEFLEQVA